MGRRGHRIWRGAKRTRGKGAFRYSTLAALLMAGGFAAQFAHDADSATGNLAVNDVPSVSVIDAAATGSVLTGKASVIDGDTIDIHGQHIRLDGIDAPETAQRCKDAKGKPYRCGQKAANFLDRLIAASNPVRCTFKSWDQYGRFVGECFRSDGESLNAAMVRSGHALGWPKHSNGKYASDQRDAEAERLGMWVGTFEPAWEFRAAQRAKTMDQAPQKPTQLLNAVPATGQAGSGGCIIKGNISSGTGERIYHMPGQKHYAKTRISPGKGERWFCSEEDALAAGWRRSRQ